MSLFMDGNITTIEDLRAYDSSILTVASVEQVDLGSKMTLAQRELEVELQQMLALAGPSVTMPGGLPPVSSLQLTPAAIDLSAVVVTEPLRQWHCLRSLVMVYRDAYFSQLNDRYYGKLQGFMELDARTSGILFNTGIGIASDPIPQAAAPVATVSAGTMPPATYYIRVGWLNSGLQEGQGSVVMPVVADQFHTLSVQAVNPPSNAVSWNIYAGGSDSTLARQNSAPLDPGATWSLSDSGLIGGPGPCEGQAPDYFYKIRQVIQRG